MWGNGDKQGIVEGILWAIVGRVWRPGGICGVLLWWAQWSKLMAVDVVAVPANAIAVGIVSSEV